jgi:hypothetical protein
VIVSSDLDAFFYATSPVVMKFGTHTVKGFLHLLIFLQFLLFNIIFKCGLLEECIETCLQKKSLYSKKSADTKNWKIS